MESRICAAAEDLAAELTHSRRHDDVGRLALLCFCQVRQLAREAHESQLSELSWRMFIGTVPQDRESFLARVDAVIDELQRVRTKLGNARTVDERAAATELACVALVEGAIARPRMACNDVVSASEGL